MTRAFGDFGGSHPFFTNKDHNIQNRRTKGKHAPEDSHTLALPHVLDRVLGHLDLRGFLRVGPRISRIQIHFFSEFRSCHDLCDGKFRLERRVRLGWSRRFLPANTVNIFLSVSGDPASLGADSQRTREPREMTCGLSLSFAALLDTRTRFEMEKGNFDMHANRLLEII